MISILKKLIEFLISFGLFKKKIATGEKLPAVIRDNEAILRIIFSPLNVSKDGKTVKPNAYRPPPGKDEISVVRANYCSLKFCKKYGKKIQSAENKKNYFGFGILYAIEIRELDADVLYTPIRPDNIYHSDIKIGFIPKKGEELPAEYQYKVRQMAKKARLIEDPNPNIDEWSLGTLSELVDSIDN